ncbi:MAG: CinA family nicotinamide mononucleotide deamidase-related protein [Chloroflexi bacterium]|nr:CinA family nicotinamide mononucleotide deamidase-related protein [Chloroflexota bacterium]
MNAEIIAIGTEILLGELVDTNSNYIARILRDSGINVYFFTTVGDNQQRITQVLRAGLERSDVIITTGGLGPTVDDMTRPAVASALGKPLVFRQDLYDQIADRFARFGARMSENNRQQAYIPEGALPIENTVGTAPCFIAESSAGTIISLPGVPREMKHLMQSHVVPYLQQRNGTGKIIKSLILKTAGIGESHLDEKIGELMANANPTIGLSAHTGQTDIRITASAETVELAMSMLEDMAAQVRNRIGDYIYGEGDYPLENAIVDVLQMHGQKLAICEAGTDGSLHQRLKSVPQGPGVLAQAEAYPDVGALRQAYPNSADTLDELTEAAAKRLVAEGQATVAIAIATQSSSTAIAVSDGKRIRQRTYGFGGEETQAHLWAATWGLSFAWRLLREIQIQE